MAARGSAVVDEASSTVRQPGKQDKRRLGAAKWGGAVAHPVPVSFREYPERAPPVCYAAERGEKGISSRGNELLEAKVFSIVVGDEVSIGGLDISSLLVREVA